MAFALVLWEDAWVGRYVLLGIHDSLCREGPVRASGKKWEVGVQGEYLQRSMSWKWRPTSPGNRSV